MRATEFIIDNVEEKLKNVPTKPRNFVAKNAMKTTSGAGAHRDKKKEQKQGDFKHKNQGVAEDDVEEGWKSKLAGAALAGAAAFGGGGQAQAAEPAGINATGNNAAIVQSLVNPVAQQRFAAQHADTTAKLTDPRYDHNPDALAQHQAAPKQQHAEMLQNIKNIEQWDNPYRIIQMAMNMAGVTPKEVLQNLPKGYKLPATEPKGTFVPKDLSKLNVKEAGKQGVAEEVDLGQYAARKSAPDNKDNSEIYKIHRERMKQYGDELEQRQKEKQKDVKEGISNSNQDPNLAKAYHMGVSAYKAYKNDPKRAQMAQDKIESEFPQYLKMWTTGYYDGERFDKQSVKKTDESLEKYVDGGVCPKCGGEMVSEELITEKQDACYHKVKSRYKIWPSAYASGALVKCRKAGAANWGNKSKK